MYDGGQEAGYPKCGELLEAARPEGCDADYVHEDRPEEGKEAVDRVSLTGRIGKPMLALDGTFDALLPIDTDSHVYAKMIKEAGKRNIHRYYTIEEGNHVDS